RAREWIIGMQGKDGGWGAFDADNAYLYLNHIPFADHGALLDPSTADVTARCVSFLAQLPDPGDAPVIARALACLPNAREQEGRWSGSWGSSYINRTWSERCMMNAARIPEEDLEVGREVAFLLETQRDDGGWGENNESFGGAPLGRSHRSNPSQTACAL